MCQILQGTCYTKRIKSFFVDLKAKFSLISCILFGNSTHSYVQAITLFLLDHCCSLLTHPIGLTFALLTIHSPHNRQGDFLQSDYVISFL